MIQCLKEQTEGLLKIKLIGSIDESTDFHQCIGVPSGPMELNCKAVIRINSMGVRNWIDYFQSLELKKVSFKFIECSLAIVEQMNLISNFSCGGEVESLLVPFTCKKCKNELMGVCQTKELIESHFVLPEVNCLQCHGLAIFDDFLEEFFLFLKK